MKRNIQETSLLAYRSIPNLGDRQQTVLVYIHGHPDCTDLEVAEGLGYQDPNMVRPRRYDLVELGLVVASGKRRQRNGKLALTWRVKA